MSSRFLLAAANRKFPFPMFSTGRRIWNWARSAPTSLHATSPQPSLPTLAMKSPMDCFGSRAMPAHRWLCLTAYAPIFRLRALGIIPARLPRMFSIISFSPTTTVMWMNLSVGHAHRLAMAATLPCRARVASMSTNLPTTRRSLWRTAHGGDTKCRPTISSRQTGRGLPL